jgi:hypothetical protein
VAAIAIAVIVVIALVISRAGGEGAGDVTPTTDAEGAANGTETASSGIPVTRGVVPNVVGLQSERAKQALDEAGYEVREITEQSQDVARGEVVQQAPAAGTDLAEGQEVIISVSTGPQ